MPDQCTEAEWKIMEVLWDHSPRTMTEITAILEPTTGWTRHTVITLLKRMLENLIKYNQNEEVVKEAKGLRERLDAYLT